MIWPALTFEQFMRAVILERAVTGDEWRLLVMGQPGQYPDLEARWRAAVAENETKDRREAR